MSRVRFDTDPRHVVRITLARPDRKNAFDAAMIAEITAAARTVDENARAVILDSEGDAFCAGADIDWMRSMADYSLAENTADSGALAAMYRALYELAVPLIVRVQGAALGGGAGLVAVHRDASRDPPGGRVPVRRAQDRSRSGDGALRHRSADRRETRA